MEVSKVGDAADAHVLGFELGAKGETVWVRGERRFGGGFAVEDDAVGIGVERGAAIGEPEEMEFGARDFPFGAFDKLDGREVERSAVGEFEEDRVVQVGFGVAEDSERLDTFDHEDVVRQLFDLDGSGGLRAILQLTEAKLGETNGFRRPPKDGNRGLMRVVAEANAGDRLGGKVGLGAVGHQAGERIDLSRGEFALDEFGIRRAPGRILQDAVDVLEIPFIRGFVPRLCAEERQESEPSGEECLRRHGLGTSRRCLAGIVAAE